MSTNRKPRFILIDPSALHTGGHHYEYATRILNLAAEKGFDTELWAHRKSNLPDSLFRVRALFNKSYYENFSALASFSFLKAFNLRSAVKRRLVRVYEKFSKQLFCFIMETKMGLHISRAIHDASRMRFRPVYASPQNRIKTPTLAYIFFFAAYLILKRIKYFLTWKNVKILAYAFALMAALLLLPVFAVAGIFAGCYVVYRASLPKAYQIFARDLEKGLALHNEWSASDIIYVPTSFSTEIRALGEFFDRWNGKKSLPQFHLLFRTNVFTGFTGTHRDQLPFHLEYRQSFKWLEPWYDKGIIHYYTDTDQLSAQYKILSDAKFGVLPVPVPWTVDATQTTERSGRPINIAYVGDVRDEKGYQFYPPIISALWTKYIATGKIKFTLQSNLADNLDVSRESAVAQSILQAQPSDIVTHVNGPLSSVAYQDLINQADIVLITYRPEPYMARSSGIFIEALKAGKAVLMPSATWMTSIIETPRQQRWSDAVQKARLMQGVKGRDWSAGDKLALNATAVRWTIVEFQIKKNDEDDIFVELSAHCEHAASPIHKFRVAQVRADGKCTIMVTLPEQAKNITVGYKILGGEARLQSAEIYVSTEAWQGAEDYAASIYARQDEHYMTEALSELVDHLDAYQQDVRRFVRSCGQEYTPETLVERLLMQAGYQNEEKTQVAA